jgi:hypothetical protein
MITRLLLVAVLTLLSCALIGATRSQATSALWVSLAITLVLPRFSSSEKPSE